MARNPFPFGWEPGQLDQGWDGKFNIRVVSPVWGKIIYAQESVPGWNGGGLVAVQMTRYPRRVYYFAEGIVPYHPVGTRVWPGRWIGLPKRNPYNGVVGNIEWGRANPAQPTQPLAQIVVDRRDMVLDFYRWARGLGLPAATSTSGAGYPSGPRGPVHIRASADE